MTDRRCEATRYGPHRDCEGEPKFDVVYRSAVNGAVLDRHAACLRHGVAEVDRHDAAAGIARVDVEEAP